ncbi:alpha/beta fold hydrolase [Halorarum halobium]|uniref:alpha/beta fold hydrolase n=1 Tax=Halorarum halobium TaxID=3075121 RepID=UPI0028AD22AB|nr:alpha/beta hydrolase [Halobaculum sp. XH14]
MSQSYTSRYLDVNDLKTHYLEAGEGNDETLVLIHSGEFGATAELSWEPVIDDLAEDYHVLAPDLLGYGRSEKVFDFGDQFDRRVRHVGAFLDALYVDEAHFIGHSMGAGYIASLACEDDPEWNMNKIVLVSGGGGAPQGFGEILHNFEATEEDVREILSLLFYEEWYDQAYVDRKRAASRIPGHWQSTAAIRFNTPFEEDREFRRSHEYERVDVPTLIFGGQDDPLQPPEAMTELHEMIPGSELVLLEETHHSAHIEHPEEFLSRTREFLES